VTKYEVKELKESSHNNNVINIGI